MSVPEPVRDDQVKAKTGDSRQWFYFAFLLAALALFFGRYAAVELGRYPLRRESAGAIYFCFLLLMALYLAPGFAISRSWLVRRFRGVRGAAASVLLFLLPYLIYAAGTSDFRWTALAKIVALAALPLGLFAVLPVADARRLNWQDVLALVWLFLPIFFHLTGGIWNIPVNLDFMARMFLVGVGAWSFLIQRGVGNSGYDFALSPAIAGDAILSFAGFTFIAIPLGFVLRFVAWNPQYHGLRSLLSSYATIFLFVAIAEELFFRGLLQNLLEGSLGSRRAAQAAASVLFGFSHVLHAPFPNWRYVALATIAGWFYGEAYRRHHSLMASAGAHALVDTLWRTWFTLPG